MTITTGLIKGRRHLIIIAFMSHMLTTSLASAGPYELHADSPAKAKVDYILSCFKNRLKIAAATENDQYHNIFKGYKVTSETDAALTELIPVFYNDIKTMDPRSFCQDKLLPSFIKKYAEAKENMVRKNAAGEEGMTAQTNSSSEKRFPDLGFPGTRAMSADTVAARAVAAGHSVLYSHIVGHSDITSVALNELISLTGKTRDSSKELERRCNCTMSQFTKELVESASQSPDLYEWDTDSYHAQTKEHNETDTTQASEHAQVSLDEFKAQINKMVKQIRAWLSGPASARSYPRAAFQLGALCHLVQDLVFHHGITAKQHSGLAYINQFRNPDFPLGIETVEAYTADTDFKEGTPAREKFSMAKNFTKEIVVETLAGTDSEALRQLFGLSENSFKNGIAGVAQAVYKHTARVTPWKMYVYRDLHTQYSEPFVELDRVNKDNFPWNPSQVLKDVLGEIRMAR